MMQVNASDNLVMKQVEFLVDNELKMTLMKPPFIILWPMRLGEHTLLVRAYDLAGNMSEADISFLVEKK
jgi:hypothetical protein